jgi:DUF2924 family protein
VAELLESERCSNSRFGPHFRSLRPATIGRGPDDLERNIASLPTLDTAALRQRWKALFSADPSPHFGRSVLVNAISYRVQERALGGLKPTTQRLLDRIAEGSSKNLIKRVPNQSAGAGTVLTPSQRPVNTGARLAVKAAIASRASWVRAIAPMLRSSISI